MGKDGFLTPKAIANRIKAKGLQKLRWYCQMCDKQCRDENGFKCHCMSEGHQRQMQIFAQNPNDFMDTFSLEFEAGMMEIISRKARNRVHSNIVYQEYIADRAHVHMNSTMWETLTDFVIYLGRTGKCEVDQTDKGWFIKWIDKDPAKLMQAEQRAKRATADVDAEERHTRELMRLAKRAREEGGAEASAAGEAGPSTLERAEGEGPLQLSLALGPGVVEGSGGGGGASKRAAVARPPVPIFSEAAAADGAFPGAGAAPCGVGGQSSKAPAGAAGGSAPSAGAAPRSAMEAIMREEQQRKEKAAAKAAAAAAKAPGAFGAAQGGHSKDGQPWIAPGVVVKIMSKAVAKGKYYKSKGVVARADAQDPFVAHVQVLRGGEASGDVLGLDERDLETVIPSVGGPVRVVRGMLRGARATLLEIDEAAFSVAIRVEEGPRRGERVAGVEYEDVCKIHVPRGSGAN